MVEWRRPEEMADEPAMVKDGTAPGDVKQGILGDCWLLGSLLILSTHPELL
jgi:Calpain family cysteine protease